MNLVIKGLEKALKRIDDAGDRARDLRPAWAPIAADFHDRERDLFENEGGAEGWAQWEPLDPAYAERKKREGKDDRILVRDGTLSESLGGYGPGFIFAAEPQTVEMGTDVKYAKYHQYARGGRKKREPIRITDDQVGFWVAVIERWINEGDV